jgi:3-phosphoshikimate 1-carboxyvinyltransferase
MAALRLLRFSRIAMPLPSLIELVPPSRPIRAAIVVPGSKSITNRALILAALAEGETVLNGALWSEDTEVMVDCLRDLGYMISVGPDPDEPCNRIITVYGRGSVPHGGTEAQPLELFVGNAGTAARFLAAFVCLGSGFYRLHGVPRMHQRPQAELFEALRQLGHGIHATGDRLPAIIHAHGPKPGRCRVSMKSSSQFASALLLAAPAGKWEVEIEGENEEEASYVAMTRDLMKAFPRGGGAFQIEPDASSASYFLAANHLLSTVETLARGSSIALRNAPATTWQVDARFEAYLPVPAEISRRRDLGDSILTAMIVAAFAPEPVRFIDLGRLRVQECERVMAMRTELTKCGVRVREEADSLTLWPSAATFKGAEIETYDDHRMAMCFAVAGLVVPGMRIRNPGCVRKTFPNFFQKLGLPHPDGLGTVILDGRSGTPLDPAALSA